MNPILTKSYDAEAAITARRIVKFGAADYGVVQGAANTDALIGVADLGADAAGDRVDVHRGGLADVEYGGNVTRGDLLTTDGNGRAITAVAGAGVRAIGVAEVSGVLGDIGKVLIAPCIVAAS